MVYEASKQSMTWMEHALQISLEIYALSMEDKILRLEKPLSHQDKPHNRRKQDWLSPVYSGRLEHRQPKLGWRHAALNYEEMYWRF